MKQLRIFIGIKLDLAAYQQKIQDCFDSKSSLMINWTKEDNLHLTFLFIGSIEVKYIKVIKNSLQNDLKGITSFNIQIEGCGIFQKRRSRNILWLKIKENKNLVILRKRIVEGFNKNLSPIVNLKHEDYNPHITIARYKHGLKINLDNLNKRINYYQDFLISEVQIIESRTGKNGIEYVPIETISL